MSGMWLKERLGMVYEKRNRSNDKSDMASACYFLLVSFGPMLLEKLMEAMINSINMQAESLVDQLLR